ncbi:hypothetical protein TcCL_NonESM11733 [Trypanosoma cruzi]|nr:hypothetical protein TcCL_NonESM11733 [Trypanosoma cruzi]
MLLPLQDARQGRVGRSHFPPSSFTSGGSSRRTPVYDARLLKEAGIIGDASSATKGGWIAPFCLWRREPPVCDADYPHITRGLCRRNPRRKVPPSAVGLGERLRHIIENIIVSESSIPRKRHRPPTSRMHRSMEAELFSFQALAT